MARRGTKVWPACAVLFLIVAACSPQTGAQQNEDGNPILNWYMAPDRVDAEVLAEACSEDGDDGYEIRVRDLPADAQSRRTELVRRLSAEDNSIDLISLDTELTAEFGAAGLLAPVPSDLEPAFVEDVFGAALDASTYNGELVSVPWWFDPQLVWYRGTVAERAGLDFEEPQRWEDLIDGARRVGATIQFEDPEGTGISQLVGGLVAEAGGTIVDGPGRDAVVGLDTDAGRAAARVIEQYDQAQVGDGPTELGLESFAGPLGGFLVAPTSVISDPALASVAADLQWTRWPSLEAGAESVAPLSGRGLAVSLYSPNSQKSFQAISCLTSPPSMQALMLSSGHASARSTTFDSEEIEASYPLAEEARASIENGSHAPMTPYWSQISAAIESTWSPISGVTVAETPAESQSLVEALLRGELE